MAAPVINTPAHLEHRIQTPDGRTLAVAEWGDPDATIRSIVDSSLAATIRQGDAVRCLLDRSECIDGDPHCPAMPPR
jgi:hypothetical protein